MKLYLTHCGFETTSSHHPPPPILRASRQKNSITVAYSNNQHIQKLNKNLVGGLDRLHYDLTTNLLKCTGTDPTRSTGKVDHSLPSQTVRLCFGYGWVQKPSPSKVNWTVHTWNYRGLHMPIIKYKPFTSLPNSLQKQLITVFEAGHIFAESHYNHPFSNECNELRT